MSYLNDLLEDLSSHLSPCHDWDRTCISLSHHPCFSHTSFCQDPQWQMQTKPINCTSHSSPLFNHSQHPTITLSAISNTSGRTQGDSAVHVLADMQEASKKQETGFRSTSLHRPAATRLPVACGFSLTFAENVHQVSTSQCHRVAAHKRQ